MYILLLSVLFEKFFLGKFYHIAHEYQDTFPTFKPIPASLLTNKIDVTRILREAFKKSLQNYVLLSVTGGGVKGGLTNVKLFF